jgi:magnesium transporter
MSTQNPQIPAFELSKEYLDFLKDSIEANESSVVYHSLKEANYVDIVTILYELNTEESKYVVNLLKPEMAADVLAEVDESDLIPFLENFTSEELSKLLDHMDSDDGADIVNQLPVQMREESIALMRNEEKSRYVKELIHYEEDVAGGLMAKELIKCNVEWTIKQCIDEIRRQAEQVEKIYSLYVVDRQNRLVGKVSLKKVILSPDRVHVADIYNDEVISVPTHLNEAEVVDIMKRYDLEAVPVVDVQNRLVGRITIDDIIDVMDDIAEEERQYMAGISEDVEENSSIWMLSRARLPWLMVGMAGGMLGARFIGVFEEDIAMVPAMAFFIPLITATGGNVGIQSSSIVLQSLYNPSIIGGKIASRLIKVFLVALLNGIVLSTLVFSINFALGTPLRLSAVVAFALLSVVLLASFMGTITPLVLNRLGINPALASGPFITTFNDLLGLGVYFTVAHFLYDFS